MSTCESCHGQCVVICWVCNGIGIAENDPSSLNKTSCWKCKGLGEITCPDCDGFGQEEHDSEIEEDDGEYDDRGYF